MLNAKKEELIEELKALRDQTGMTYQQIADATEKIGYPVSLSTVKNVFSDKNKHDHDYTNTLKPIADVLNPPTDNLEHKILVTELEYKDEIIKHLKNRVDSKEQKYSERERFYIQQIEFLQEQIKSKDEIISHHNEALDRKDNTIKELYSIIIGMKKAEEVFV